MPILTFLKLLLTIASSLAKYASEKKLMDAGAAEAVLKGVRDADEAVDRANLARKSGGVPVDDDPNNRDNA